jgi:Nucleotide modification associated domain 2
VGRLYVYKIRYDDGTAPCVQGGVLSLALCKPAIRATARVGDTLVGFSAKSMCADQRLVYAAVVTDRLADGDYYRQARWRGRIDCIYEWRGGAFRRRRDARVHATSEDRVHDLGEPPAYPRANVLLSENYRYFAESRPADHSAYPALARLIDRLGQGHRIHHGERVKDELERYLAAIWSVAPTRTVPLPAGSICAARRPAERATAATTRRTAADAARNQPRTRQSKPG